MRSYVYYQALSIQERLHIQLYYIKISYDVHVFIWDRNKLVLFTNQVHMYEIQIVDT